MHTWGGGVLNLSFWKPHMPQPVGLKVYPSSEDVSYTELACDVEKKSCVDKYIINYVPGKKMIAKVSYDTHNDLYLYWLSMS